MPRHSRIYNSRRWRKLREQVLERDDWSCFYCGAELDRERPRAAQVDHVKPVALGGSAYGLANLVACCLTCNTKRGRALQDELGKPRPSERVDAIRL